jgi:hypothetical protein
VIFQPGFYAFVDHILLRPRMIERILFKALQKEPDKRYRSMEELEITCAMFA